MRAPFTLLTCVRPLPFFPPTPSPPSRASQLIKRRDLQAVQAFWTPTCDGLAQRLGEENERVRIRCAHQIPRRKSAGFDNSNPVHASAQCLDLTLQIMAAWASVRCFLEDWAAGL